MLIGPRQPQQARTPGFGARWPYLVYLFTAAVLLFLLLFGEKFWLTNDDIRMSMTVGGYGIAATPSPGLGMGMILQTSVIWGWLLMHVPDLAHIRGYTIATYFLLLVTAVVIGAALHARKVSPWFTAAALIAIYASVLLTPQFTLLAGYLAVAGFALVLTSDEHNLKLCLPLSGVLLVLAGMVRPNELVLVGWVSSPFLLHAWLTRSRRWRLHWLGLAALCVLALAAMLAYNQHYNSSSGWAAFSELDGLRAQFTDYNLGGYFAAHPGKLQGSGLSGNDIKLLRAWFYLDPSVFNPGSLGPLVHSVSVADRVQLNYGRAASFLLVFKSLQLSLLSVLFVLFALLSWRRAWPEAVSLLFMLAFMVGIALWGRPGYERVYQAAAAAMVVLTLLRLGPREARWIPVLGVATVILSLAMTANLYAHNRFQAHHAAALRARTCASLARLPKDQLVVVWTGGERFAWTAIYRPTTPDDSPCDPSLYAIGSFQLTPPSLERLHAYTGGKDFVQALLAGQQFYLITGPLRLRLFERYLQEHYHSRLSWQQLENTKSYQLYTIQATPAGGGGT